MLLLTVLVVVLPKPGWTQNVDPSSDSKPNILIILADDLHWRDLGITGNPDVYSPNINQLARDGMRLNGFFASSAVCSPLRHALYTGLYPIRSGAYPNHTMVDPETRSVFHHLKGLGYRVGLLGKTHISPAVAFPFENISSRTDEIDEAAAFFNQDEQQPWFMVFASNEPHAPWRSGPRERYDANKGPGFFFLNSIKFRDTNGWERSYMRAELTAKCDGPWAYESVRIQQGKLPQGIFLLGGEFSGAPVRAGARLVQVRVVKPSCNGVVYDDKHLWVRFDIGGERPRR
ncbi:MAG: sulfatase-like hydrolase/transferase [Gammaproteobacteria bacterium]|nr:sulfatase-like hydrolase/transferase [Gammaproteobacteria bacterium]